MAFIIERALALLFEYRRFAARFASSGVKEPIAFVVSFLVCWRWKLDALGVILHGDKVQFLGEFLTAAVIAGGSKASLKLFRDVMHIESDHAKEYRLAALERTKADALRKAA